jgi:hypothetical protein
LFHHWVHSLFLFPTHTIFTYQSSISPLFFDEFLVRCFAAAWPLAYYWLTLKGVIAFIIRGDT